MTSYGNEWNIAPTTRKMELEQEMGDDDGCMLFVSSKCGMYIVSVEALYKIPTVSSIMHELYRSYTVY